MNAQVHPIRDDKMCQLTWHIFVVPKPDLPMQHIFSPGDNTTCMGATQCAANIGTNCAGATICVDISSAFSQPQICLDNAVDEYNTALKNIMDTHAPFRAHTVVDYPNHPWINNEILAIKHE